MTERNSFLAHIVDPFAETPPRLVLVDSNGDCRTVQACDLGKERAAIFTHDAWKLVDAFRRSGEGLPPVLIDFEIPLKLRSGLAKDEGGKAQWGTIKAAQPFFAERDDFGVIIDLLEAKRLCTATDTVDQLLEQTARALMRLWEKLSADICSLGEHERFWRVEVPLQQVFWARQLAGIRVNSTEVAELIERAQNDKYNAYRYVAEKLSCRPGALNFHNIGDHLGNTDASHLGEFAGQSNLEDYFAIAAKQSEFARQFIQLMESAMDVKILTSIWSANDRVFPVFQPFGTVTGRILTSDPRLQALRKRHRTAICADEGKRLVYLDYSQFEPGILAYVANDDRLREHYNQSDLYEELSLAMFKTVEHRALCKKLFLSYCFGMKIENMAKALSSADFDLAQLNHYESVVRLFFDQFPALPLFRQKVEAELRAVGSVRTLMGNHRKRTSGGELTSKERRWAVSQVVQGTASLIFKEATNQISVALGAASVLLPMHDALLLQVDDDPKIRKEFVSEASGIMEKCLRERCPGILSRVRETSFAERK